MKKITSSVESSWWFLTNLINYKLVKRSNNETQHIPLKTMSEYEDYGKFYA